MRIREIKNLRVVNTLVNVGDSILAVRLVLVIFESFLLGVFSLSE